MDIYGIIYKATNLINGKVYIGQTIRTIEERKTEHLRDSAKNIGYQFYRAIRKYGWNNFNWSVIDCSYNREELNDKEIFWIEYYKSYSKIKDSNGYNMTRGGESLSGDDNPFYGKLHSKESKMKMSESATGKVLSEYTKKKIGETYSRKYKGENNPRYGTKVSIETKERMSEAHRGKKKSESHKQNIAKSKRGENNPTAKCVIQISLDGDFIAEYKTIKEASDVTGAQSTHIVNCCKNNIKSSGGYIWLYKEDFNKENVKNKVKDFNEGSTSKKSVVQLSKSGDFIKEYPSLNEGAIAVGGDRSSIAKCCKDFKKSCKGFKWMYKEDYEKIK